MDLETENRIAAILMQEAKKLRLQAEKEGVGVYLREPKERGRPNSRFLTATVLGVQQANRAAEVSEMWRVRKKELELDDRLTGRFKDKSRGRSHSHNPDSSGESSNSRYEEVDKSVASSCTSRKRENEDCYAGEDGGLRDEEIEEFLHSRVKRGRGAVGSRTDEPGPYLPPSLDSKGKLIENPDVRMVEEWEQRILGPEKPPFLKSHERAAEVILAPDERKKAKKVDAVVSSKKSLKKRHSKHRSKDDKSRDKKKKDKRHKHHRKQ